MKLYGINNKELDELIFTVKKISDDSIGMEFGLDKCAKVTFIRGRLTSTSEIKVWPNYYLLHHLSPGFW